jgi:hypothetical protein|tara:strand:+ start:148 stop:1134 length:987 start_codon:yes stop_codon:yes gene_type:complete
MSNIVSFTSEVPDHIASRIGKPSTLAQSLAGGITSGPEYSRISIKGSRFRIIDAGAESVLDTTSLELVIVGANLGLAKAWYATAWTPDADSSAPDCFTMDGERPDAQSTQPQNDLCASCPQNAWGSRVTQQGTKVKACADNKRLAVVAADDPTGPIFLLQVTPAALKGLNQYQKELTSRGFAPEIVRTIVSFDTSASFPKLKFDFGGFIDDATIAKVEALLGSPAVMEITGVASATALPAPTTAPVAGLAPPAVAEPVAVPVKPEEAAPEKKHTGFGAATVEAPAKTETPTEPVDEPAKAPVANAGISDLADEITALIEEVADDDPSS